MTGQDKRNSHCFQADSHASRFPLSDLKGGLRTPVISGQRCAALLRNCGPITCLAKMLLTSSIWGSARRSLTWERRDMQSGHSYFLLVPSVRGMNGNGLSSWGLMFPTPLASDTGTKGRVSRVTLSPKGAFRRQKANGEYWSASLSEAVYFLSPAADAAMRINPEWVEWMMGFPKGWTESASGA